MKSVLSLILLISSVFLASCEQRTGPVIDRGGTGCHAGLAQIGVGDGFFEALCGCTGGPADGTILTAPANLVCHVPAGTEVMFQFIDVHTTHQIINSGGLNFPSGAVIQPGAGIYTSAAQFNDVGTYLFEDAYDNALTGQIIVP